MTTIEIKDASGKKAGSADLAATVFGIEPNMTVMHTVVRSQRAAWRQGTSNTLTRGQVRGGGKKPWRQKGTGRARQGSIRSPQWTHGGIALGPKPRDYSYRLNKKVKRLALLSALSSKAQSGDIIVIDELKAAEYKTKTVVNMLTAIGADKKALIVTPAVDAKLVKSAANIPGVKTATADSINTYEVLNGGKFVISVDAAKKLEEVFA